MRQRRSQCCCWVPLVGWRGHRRRGCHHRRRERCQGRRRLRGQSRFRPRQRGQPWCRSGERGDFICSVTVVWNALDLRNAYTSFFLCDASQSPRSLRTLSITSSTSTSNSQSCSTRYICISILDWTRIIFFNRAINSGRHTPN